MQWLNNGFSEGVAMRKFQGIPCPKRGKKGLRYPDHAHASGFKDYGRVSCRYCHGRWIANDKFDRYVEKQEKLSEST